MQWSERVSDDTLCSLGSCVVGLVDEKGRARACRVVGPPPTFRLRPLVGWPMERKATTEALTDVVSGKMMSLFHAMNGRINRYILVTDPVARWMMTVEYCKRMKERHCDGDSKWINSAQTRAMGNEWGATNDASPHPSSLIYMFESSQHELPFGMCVYINIRLF